MSTVFNFDEVEESTGRTNLSPGVYETKITKVEFGKSKNKGTEFIKVTFQDDKSNLIHSEDFYLSKGALPRVQHLVSQATGVKLTGEVTEQSLSAKLIGKRVRIALGGEKKINNSGDVVTYSQLGFGGFAQPINSENKFTDSDYVITDKTGGYVPAVDSFGGPLSSSSQNNDDDNELPF